MEYTVSRLSRIAGVSTRTLRYYDEIGLLSPKRVSSNGYRIYGQAEVLRLQQILFYRELEVPLGEIRKILNQPDFEPLAALELHLSELTDRRARLDRLIQTAQNTISDLKGGSKMTDKERFDGFKRELIEQNEAKYGAEIRQKYGEKTVDESNRKLMNMTEEQYAAFEQLNKEFNETLKQAFLLGDPGSALAQEAARLHKEWLMFSWPNYDPDAHVGLTQMYVDDERFTAYYDQIAKGSAPFLRDAVAIFCQRAGGEPC